MKNKKRNNIFLFKQGKSIIIFSLSGNYNFMKKFFFTIVISIIISLIIVESLSRIIVKPPKYSQLNKRYRLFEENKIFKNLDNFFLYYPNKKILSEGYYDINKKFIKEYSFTLSTNNLGLVQDNNLNQNQESILFLGDSFTEGHGSYAWINKFKGSYNNFQVINGGILGTGPAQFYNLENYLSKQLNVKKVIFIFIGDDFQRKVYTIPKRVQKCLENQKKCIGDEKVYGFNKKNQEEINLYLSKLKKYRINNLNIIRKLKNQLKGLNIISIPSSYYESNFRKNYDSNFKLNLEKTDKLIEKYNKNIIFVRLNTKQEILIGKSYWSNIAEDEIKKRNKKIHFCNFKNDINLFYKYDGHPNNAGYDYLYDCILEILNKEIN